MKKRVVFRVLVVKVKT